MEIEKLEKLNLNQLVERKQWIYRANAHGNMPTHKMDRELAYIEPKIRELTQAILREKHIEMQEQAEHIKKTVYLDGDMKRSIAREIIKILEPVLSEKELKGMFRQGYKIMRGRAQ